MDKYINSIKVLNFIQDCLNHEDKISDTEKATLIAIQRYIERIQIEDVSPVIHGKWIRKRTVEHEGEWYCSICGKDMLYTWGPGCGLADYCPHCGARMDGEQNG